MNVANLTRYSIYPTVHENEELSTIKDNCGEWVKFEEAVEASSNSLQQLKAEIAAIADSIVVSVSDFDITENVIAVKKLRQLSAV